MPTATSAAGAGSAIFVGASCGFVSVTDAPRIPNCDVPQHWTPPCLSTPHVALSPADSAAMPEIFGAFVARAIHGGFGGSPHAPDRHWPQHITAPSFVAAHAWMREMPSDA